MKTPENPFSARLSEEEMQQKLEKLSPEQKALFLQEALEDQDIFCHCRHRAPALPSRHQPP